MYDKLYGNYRNRKFTDIFPDVDDFLLAYNDSGIPTTITTTNATTLYYLLYARYGNSTIASSDETQFTYKVMAIIYQYGPTWEKRLEIQTALRGLSADELVAGTRQIMNHAQNPGTEPTTATLSELDYIDSQNTVNYKKSKMDGYATLMALLDTDVSEEFLGKFKRLFLSIVEPELPLWYTSEEEE
jgi:hypothetical protein